MNQKGIAAQFGVFVESDYSLPFDLVNKTIPELEAIFSAILAKNFNQDDHKLIALAYRNAKKAHDDTGVVRKGSKVPYIQHPLAVAILAWHLASIVQFKNIDPLALLIAAISHDTVEDTKIYGTTDTGLQLSSFAKDYGERTAIIVSYLTKIPLNIDSDFEKLKNHFKRNHLIMFDYPFVPMESRITKLSDRLINTSDLNFSPIAYKKKTLYFTEKHFEPVLNFLEPALKLFYYQHIEAVKKKSNPN